MKEVCTEAQVSDSLANLVAANDIFSFSNEFSTAVVNNHPVFASAPPVNQPPADEENNGGEHDDCVILGPNFDFYVGTYGDDCVHDEGGGGKYLLLDGNDTFISDTVDSGDNDIVCAGGGDDLVITGHGQDFVDAGSGDDHVNSGAGRDHINGGKGNDYLNGGSQDDYIDGGNGDDIITGNFGSDTLKGGKGDDSLNGVGSDVDYLTGGAGNDFFYFHFNDEDHNNDIVTDFTAGEDRIHVTIYQSVISGSQPSAQGYDGWTFGVINNGFDTSLFTTEVVGNNTILSYNDAQMTLQNFTGDLQFQELTFNLGGELVTYGLVVDGVF